MADRKTVNVKLPPYESDHTAWRTAIFTASKAAAKKAQVTYERDEKLDLRVWLYFSKGDLAKNDIDNRLKDVFDGLQGALGGEGKKRYRKGRVIRNDRQVYSASVEKFVTPNQALDSGGSVRIRCWRGRKNVK